MKINLLLSLLIPFCIWGQDSTVTKSRLPLLTSESISYLQFNTVRDPANAGIQGRNFVLNSFSNLPNDFFNEIHNQISLDGYVDKNKSVAIGVYYTLDNWSNRFYKNSLGFVLKKKVKDFHLGLGIEKNTIYIDSSNLVFGDMIDPRVGIIYPTYDLNSGYKASYLSVNPSIIYSAGRIQSGISINNLTETNNSLLSGDGKASRQINVNVSYLFHFQPKWCYVPMLQFSHSIHSQQLEIHNVITFSDLRKTHFLDLVYINNSAVSGQYGMNFNNRLKFSAKVNIPIYYRNYFPLSVQAGLQYTFKPKK